MQVARRSSRSRSGLLRDHDPQQKVDQRTDAAEEKGSEKEQPEENRIEVEVLAQTGAHAGELLVFGRAMKLLHSALQPSGPRNGSPRKESLRPSTASGQRSLSIFGRCDAGRGLPSQPTCSMYQ